MVKKINQMLSPIKNRNKILNLTLAKNKEHKQDTKPDIRLNKEHKQDIKPNIEFDKVTYEEEKVVLLLGITSIFTVWWMFK